MPAQTTEISHEQSEAERLCALAKTRELTPDETKDALRLAFTDPEHFDRIFDEIIFGPIKPQQGRQPVL